MKTRKIGKYRISKEDKEAIALFNRGARMLAQARMRSYLGLRKKKVLTVEQKIEQFLNQIGISDETKKKLQEAYVKATAKKRKQVSNRRRRK